MKQKLIIWGGWWGQDLPLALDTINSHASVTAYFLTKHLSEFYDILNIYDFYSAKCIANQKDVIGALSTYQCGFTKMSEKGRSDDYRRIRENFGGRLCSIVDGIYSLKYNEDILFTVRPPKSRIASFIRRFHKDIIIERCGWPAEPTLCFPEDVAEGEINIFVDHSWYGGALDCSRIYFNAFKEIVSNFPNITFNIYRQNNDGIIKWDLGGEFNEPKYLRSSKVPYLQIIKIYRKCHIFCVTHPESAGLAAIEAAMCGAKLYVPSNFFRSYISEELLKDGVEYTSFRCSKKEIVSALKKDIEEGFKREEWRKGLLNTNTWKAAAEKIHNTLLKIT